MQFLNLGKLTGCTSYARGIADGLRTWEPVSECTGMHSGSSPGQRTGGRRPQLHSEQPWRSSRRCWMAAGAGVQGNMAVPKGAA